MSAIFFCCCQNKRKGNNSNLSVNDFFAIFIFTLYANKIVGIKFHICSNEIT